MASHSTSQEIVPSRPQSTSSTSTRSARLRSLFSARCNCFNCSPFQSNSMASTSSTSVILAIPASHGITPSSSHTHAPSTSTFTSNSEREAENEHTNAFEGIAPSASTFGRSTMPERKLPYDVFINHRGPDVKHTVAASLYKTLTVMGLRVFLDREELELGDFLSAEIQEAMRSASLHIAIFSQNYADSPWCLAELAFMLKTGTQIVPVFYHVEPDVVRYAKGVYAEAFSRHEEKGRHTLEKIQEWKNALGNVSYNFGGIVRNEDDEMRLLKNIVNRVLKEIKNVPFEVAKHPVGLDEVVKDFERTILQPAESHHTVQTVGIWGMGGSGKTTIAKQIYNNKYSILDKSSFLLDVRDAASRSRLHKKQKKLLEDLGLSGVSIENIEEGKRILSNRLQSVRVLIILDDVDSVDQLDALVPKRDSLGWGSLIVVTSRDFEVLRSGGISSIYKMKALDPTHAKQLFCWHAFLQPFPRQGFEDLVESFLNVCDGLPLSLKVFGALLYGVSNKNYWKIQLHKISKILPKDIKDRLKVSYDALDDEEKQVFLDISCFFIGEEKTSAIAAWDGSGWNGLHCWEQLLNKCLVEFNDENYIRMHDHLRDLGREIALHQSPYRLWSPQQVINVDNQIQGISIRGITAIESGFTSKDEEFPKWSKGGKLIVNTNRGPYSLEPCSLGLKIFNVDGNCCNQVIRELSRELVWLRWNSRQHSNLSSLGSLKNLRVLELYGCGYYGKGCLKELWKTDNAPVQLRQLDIKCFGELQRLPKSIGHLQHLKKIVMRHSCELKSLSEEFCLLQSLEHLELDGRELSSLPNSFGDLRNLRHLDLPYCGKLTRLPVSFKELTLLQHLNLKHCSNLTLESDILENMMKLEYLNIEGCDQLEELPRHMTNQPSLTELSCGIKKLRGIPKSIGQLRKLQRISIGGELLTSLPTSMGDLSSLTSLTISDCAELKFLPDSLGYLNLLNLLTISNCAALKCLPDSLGCLSLLNLLRIRNCPKIKCLPDSLGSLNLLTSLEIVCVGVESLPKCVRQLINLQTLDIRGCPLSELELGTGLFTCLKRIVLGSSEVSKISISEDSCPVLTSLSLCNNNYLTLVEVLPDSLEDIFLKGNPKLEALPSFAQLAFLRTFKLLGCYRVKKIHGLEHCTALEELTAETRWEEAGIESLERMERLKEVEFKAFSRSGVESCIQSMKGLQKWPSEHTILCTRAVPDGATLVNLFASTSNLSVVDSFAKRKIKSAPSLKWPSTARGCILLCYIVNCESPETSLDFAQTTGNVQEMTYIGNCYGMKLEKGKWVWIGLFTQHSFIYYYMSSHYISPRTQSWVHICVSEELNKGEEKRGEVSGVLVTGEDERVKQALIHLWASLKY